jgi:hypothetical protein
MEGRFGDLLERFENFVREREGAGARHAAVDAMAAEPTAAGDDPMAALAAAHSAYLRDESAALAQPAHLRQPEPPVGNVAAGDAEYWARYRAGSWQGEVRDDGGGADDEDRAVARKVASTATEAEYWAAYG